MLYSCIECLRVLCSALLPGSVLVLPTDLCLTRIRPQCVTLKEMFSYSKNNRSGLFIFVWKKDGGPPPTVYNAYQRPSEKAHWGPRLKNLEKISDLCHLDLLT